MVEGRNNEGDRKNGKRKRSNLTLCTFVTRAHPIFLKMCSICNRTVGRLDAFVGFRVFIVDGEIRQEEVALVCALFACAVAAVGNGKMGRIADAAQLGGEFFASPAIRRLRRRCSDSGVYWPRCATDFRASLRPTRLTAIRTSRDRFRPQAAVLSSAARKLHA